MYAPSIFNNSIVDSFFNDPFDSLFDDMFHTGFSGGTPNAMSTDIEDLGDSYRMEMELPGYEKEDLKADLKNGYLTIAADHNASNDEKDENGNYVRRERFTGHCQRSFYVGENVTKEDIKASFENGVLTLLIPKKEAPAVEEQKYIAIE